MRAGEGRLALSAPGCQTDPGRVLLALSTLDC